jgi:hypothetical protein
LRSLPAAGPIFLGLPPSRSRSRVFALEPVGRTSGAIGRVLPLRDDAFEAKPAGVSEHGRAIVVERLVEQDARQRLDKSEASVASPAARGAGHRHPVRSNRRRTRDVVIMVAVSQSVEVGMPSSPQATASPSMMIERSASSGVDWDGGAPSVARAVLFGPSTCPRGSAATIGTPPRMVCWRP